MPYIIVTAVVSLPCLHQPPPGPPGPYGPPPGNYMPYPPQHGHPGYYGQYPGAPPQPQPGYPPQPYYNYPPPPGPGPAQSGAGEAPAKPPGASAPPQAPPQQTKAPAPAQPTVYPHAQAMAATGPYRAPSHGAVFLLLSRPRRFNECLVHLQHAPPAQPSPATAPHRSAEGVSVAMGATPRYPGQHPKPVSVDGVAGGQAQPHAGQASRGRGAGPHPQAGRGQDQNRRGGRGRGGAGPRGQPLKFDSEFDFESANEKFNKDELEKVWWSHVCTVQCFPARVPGSA
jgi:hypothetical protein